MIASIQDLSRQSLLVVSGLSVAVGLLYCFLGYRLFRIVLALTGFLAGVAIGIAIGRSFDADSVGVSLAGALVGGCVGGVLFVLLYFVGVFLMGAMLGVMIAMGIGAGLGTEPPPAMLIGLAVIGGVLALAVQRLIVILVTSTLGSWGVVTGAAVLFGMLDAKAFFAARDPGQYLASNAPAILVAWVILAGIGIFAQYTVLAAPPAAPETTPAG